MASAAARPARHKPLVEIDSPIPAQAYKSKFKPYEATKYLDIERLKAAKKATIECGTLEAAGRSYPVAAEIRNGQVVALKPLGCDNCAPAKTLKVTAATMKKTLAEINAKLAERGVNGGFSPTPVAISPALGFTIPIGPIVIIIGSDPTRGIDFDFCIEINSGGESCIYCLFLPSACMSMGPPGL